VRHTAIWTGTEMIVWGGEYSPSGGVIVRGDGARYDPSTDTWMIVASDAAPFARAGHTAVWTGDEMIVWGGTSEVTEGDFQTEDSGGRYDPSQDVWVETSLDGAPSGRVAHVAFWTGEEMIVWGGADQAVESLFDGGRYNPSTDSWTPMTTEGVPPFSAFLKHAVWTGTEMVVWSPISNDSLTTPIGARYSPASDSWSPISQDDTPQVAGGEAVWTGVEMIVAGDNGLTETGGRYNPITDSWTSMNNDGAPPMSTERTAVWADSRMIVWGGFSVEGEDPTPLSSGGLYDPETDSWSATATTTISARSSHTAVWTGDSMIVWGGHGTNQYLATGGRFVP
jgi:N-acetylneuraminic acid mutarotase